jgi:hypothetical protein
LRTPWAAPVALVISFASSSKKREEFGVFMLQVPCVTA